MEPDVRMLDEDQSQPIGLQNDNWVRQISTVSSPRSPHRRAGSKLGMRLCTADMQSLDQMLSDVHAQECRVDKLAAGADVRCETPASLSSAGTQSSFLGSTGRAMLSPSSWHETRSHLNNSCAERSERLVGSEKFNLVMGVLIIVNMVFMGVELDMHQLAKRNDTMFSPFEYPAIPQWCFDLFEMFFFVVFSFELIVRIGAKRSAALMEPSTYIDGLALLPMWLEIIFNLREGRHLMLLRAARLMKLCRMIRLIRVFKELAFLVKSIVSALRTLVWIGVLILMVVYCASIVCTMFIGQNEDYRPEDTLIITYEDATGLEVNVTRYWGSIMRSMLTLFQIFTLDNWNMVVRPVVETHQPWMFIFFLSFIFLTSFGLLSLLMGAIVDHIISVAREADLERERIVSEEYKQVMLAAAHLFSIIDADRNGTLSPSELENFLANNDMKTVLEKEMARFNLKLDYEELAEVCHCIVDEWLKAEEGCHPCEKGDGIHMEEFVGAAMRLQGPAKSQDLFETKMAAKSAVTRVEAMDRSLKLLHERVEFQAQVAKERFVQLLEGLENLGGAVSVSSPKSADQLRRPWKSSRPNMTIVTNMNRNGGPPSAPREYVSEGSGDPRVVALPHVGASGSGTDAGSAVAKGVTSMSRPELCSQPTVGSLSSSSTTAGRTTGLDERMATSYKSEGHGGNGDFHRSSSDLSSLPSADRNLGSPASVGQDECSLKTERTALTRVASRRISAVLKSMEQDNVYANTETAAVLRSYSTLSNRSPSPVSPENRQAADPVRGFRLSERRSWSFLNFRGRRLSLPCPPGGEICRPSKGDEQERHTDSPPNAQSRPPPESAKELDVEQGRMRRRASLPDLPLQLQTAESHAVVEGDSTPRAGAAAPASSSSLPPQPSLGRVISENDSIFNLSETGSPRAMIGAAYSEGAALRVAALAAANPQLEPSKTCLTSASDGVQGPQELNNPGLRVLTGKTAGRGSPEQCLPGTVLAAGTTP